MIIYPDTQQDQYAWTVISRDTLVIAPILEVPPSHGPRVFSIDF